MNAKKKKFISSLSYKTVLNPIIINRLYIKKKFYNNKTSNH